MLLGKKIGMTQIFEGEKLIPVTVIEAGPNFVIQKKNVEKDGYNALTLGYDEKKEKNTIQDFFQFNNLNKNTIKDQNVHIPKNCLTCFVGVSGSGKSSLAKAINDLGGSYYISQKVSNYSTRSILCSTIKLNTLIAEYFSKKSNLITDKFLPHKLGGCPNCQGTGTIKYERGFEKDIYLTCPVCDGKLFNFSDQDIINTIIDDKNIIDRRRFKPF